ncbi:MAG: VWA domain-containing protein [Bacteroidaceae bacterium]|nr:VWA domain-containing protein [Bacteroidaceae bacterium]
MTFLHSAYLFLLLLIIPYIIWYFMARGKEPSLSVPSTQAFRFMPKSFRLYLVHVPMALQVLAFAMLVIVLARPQIRNSWRNSQVEGIDVMLCIDISTSMLAEDLKPNRIEAAKEVASQFIANSPHDNIGLTIFAAEAFTQCPLTTDHASLLNMFTGVTCDLAAGGLIDDGTAIGMGLANSISRLKESKAKSKVIILLTDGSNNQGEISPKMAAEIAHLNGIRVYTIGVGTNGDAPYPVPLPGGGVKYIRMPVEIDTQTLVDIASMTDGKFYRATSNKQLAQIYEEIGKLEKTKLVVKQYDKRHEAYFVFALIAFLALCLDILLRYVLLRRVP